ncbi:MAG: CapA family protein [Anaerolineaceae bacterium]|jgi:poly-gamma-glutamate synthesis protein (capsule biosynthesis protein)|nr:CapA family protein [Anaerolineaceae bacterium]
MKRVMMCFFLAGLLLAACGQGGVPSVAVAGTIPAVVSAPATGVPVAVVPQRLPKLWIQPDLPAAMREQVVIPSSVEMAAVQTDADLVLDFSGQADKAAAVVSWVYVLAAPFPTVRDGVSEREMKALLAGKAVGELGDVKILLSAETRMMLEKSGFAVTDDAVQVTSPDEMLMSAWQTPDTWGILPFEALEPRWKVLEVDGISPFREDFSTKEYPLTGSISLSGAAWALDEAADEITLPAGNFDRGKMTTLLMTGVTALTRSTAARMDEKGILYPGEDIREWMVSADLTHISNEVSFNPDCPPANFGKRVMHFCSRPEYIELLDDVGVDIIELSGNHLVDWGVPAFDYSLGLYEERDWTVFAGGRTPEAARQPVIVEHNGNRLAFIGCNPAGPELVWATEYRSGVADCDLDWMEGQVHELRAAGVLPVVTFQYNESYGMVPGVLQKHDFERMSAAGAVVVSGSQAHHPQTMTFLDDGFIHFGLGNLFFDQMRMPDGENVPAVFDVELPVAGTRLEFLDKHIFYDGRYIGTQLLTAILEDYARPRPMTKEERGIFLTRMFEASEWELE